MKFNLKNFPKWSEGSSYYDSVNMLIWFDGFEAELREIRATHGRLNNPRSRAFVEMAREILDE